MFRRRESADNVRAMIRENTGRFKVVTSIRVASR